MRFWRSLKKVKHLEPQVSLEEVESSLFEKKGSALLVDRYTEEDVFRMLEEKGIVKIFEEKNLTPFSIRIEPLDMHCQELTIECRGKVLMELRIGECTYTPHKGVFSEVFGDIDRLECITIEWLLVQNPFETFSPLRPRLPGQEFPGLGISKKIIEILIEIGKDLNKDSVIGFPEFYHNAVIYNKMFKFIHPSMEGKLKRMKEDLSDYPLDEVSFAFCGGCIVERNLKTGVENYVVWEAEEMGLPISEKMKRYFSSPEYTALRDESYSSFSYRFDRRKFEDTRDEIIARF